MSYQYGHQAAESLQDTNVYQLRDFQIIAAIHGVRRSGGDILQQKVPNEGPQLACTASHVVVHLSQMSASASPNLLVPADACMGHKLSQVHSAKAGKLFAQKLHFSI